jgi:hypothetical protein
MIFFIIYLIFTLMLITIVMASLSLAPWVPTRKKDLMRISSLAEIGQNDTFYDLGCGNGRTVFYINKKHGIKSIGVELAFPFYLVCIIRNFFYNNKNAKFKYNSLFKENLSDATVVYIFGLKDSMKEKLKNKLTNELKKGARVITYSFPIEGWVPAEINRPTSVDLPIYLYKI